MINLLCPAAKWENTGGYIYNKKITDELGNQLSYRKSSRGALIRQLFAITDCSVAILDSLWFHHPEIVDAIRSVKKTKWGLLCHYLPSSNPLLNTRHRKETENLERNLLELMDFCITTGPSTKSALSLRGEFPNGVHVCPPGVDSSFIDLSPVSRRTEPAPRFLTVANVLPEKGFAYLIHILSRITHYPWNWTVAGSCEINRPFFSSLKRTIKQCDLTNRIHFAGEIQAVALQMAKSDILLHPSPFESYGMACAEARANGLPIIACPAGAIPDLVTQNVNGFICRNSEEWEERLTSLLEDPVLLIQLQKRSRENRDPVRTWAEAAQHFSQIIQALAS